MGAIKLNPENPLGLSHINFSTFNQVVSGSNGRFFNVEQGDQINFRQLYDYLVANKSEATMNLSAETIAFIKAGTEPYVTNYQNECYELAGNINGGVICNYSNGLLGLTFLTDNNFWSASNIVPNVSIEGVVNDATAYVVDRMLYNGTENEDGFNRGLFGAPYGIEYLNNGVYVTDYYTDTDKALLYTGSDLYIDPLTIRSPNIINIGLNGLAQGIEYWFNYVATSDLNYEGDPQDDQGNSTSGGGDGSPQVSIDVDFPELPPSDLLDSGIIKMYKPTKSILKSVINYLYTQPDQFYTNIKKIWANPMDSIISLTMMPFDVNADGGNDDIHFCGVNTNIQCPWVKTQFVKVDCGTVRPDDMLKEEYNTILDYSNYTKVRCYLPFISTVELNTDDVMGATIHIEYNVDLLTGECIANIKCTKSDPQYNIQYNSVIYSFKGNVLSSAPITGNNYQQLYSGIMNMVTAVALPSPQAVAGIASDVVGQKVSVQRSGTMTGNSGTLGDYTPYLIVEKPIRSLPENNGKYVGYPLNMTGKISAGIKVSDSPPTYRKMSGFLQAEKDSFRCDDFTNEITDEEAMEIVSFMEGGIII